MFDRCAWASCIRWWWGGRQVLLKLRCLGGRVCCLSLSSWLYVFIFYVFAIQDGKGIVHVAFPDPRLVGWCSYRLFFETLHVEVSNDSGNRTSHGGAVFLLVNRSVILEVWGSQHEGQRSAICAGVSVVRSARLGSFSSFCSAACTAASIG